MKNNNSELLKSIIIFVLFLVLWLITSTNPMKLDILWFLDGIRAGVTEEIIFRFFFFAICIYFTNDKALSKIEGFLCYLIMIIPHVLIHFDRTNFELGGMIILSLIFGLPFAIMQRKHDLSSAIGAHAIVDIIRFCVFGA